MRRFLCVLAAVLLMPLGAAPAAASETTWTKLPCASGTLDESRTETVGTTTYVTLAGRLDCADPAGTGATFGFAVYNGRSNGSVREAGMGRYEAVPPTPFATRGRVVAGPQPRLGVCVVTDVAVRVVCVEVAWDPAQQAVAVRPLSTKDPLVDWKAYVVPDHAMSDPACGTCW